MNLHYQVHQDNFKVCENCNKKISLENGKYKAHTARCGTTGITTIHECKYCSHTSKRLHDLKVHERKVHTKEVNLFFSIEKFPN